MHMGDDSAQTGNDSARTGNVFIPSGNNSPVSVRINGSGGPEITSANQAMGKINREIEEKNAFEKAKLLGLTYIDIAQTPINPDLLYLVKPEVAKKAAMIPFLRIGKKIRVAVENPENEETRKAMDELRSKGYLLNVNIASRNGLAEALLTYESQYHEKPMKENVIDDNELLAYEKEIQSLKQLKEKFQDITSEEALNFINVGAMKTGASDIHYQPEEDKVLVRFRIDGVLQSIFHIEKGTFNNISNQIKYKAKMKLNISNVPQDGRFSFNVSGRKIDVRVSSIPTEYGETFVCRLLDSKRSCFDFETLGFQGAAREKIKEMTELVNGMILVTGPTGSGKTTTLYSLLDKFNNPENKIITLEDPIEYHLPMISQSQINEKRGYDFAGGLRSILRQDPDIIMIGEIRDLETAETAAQASLTGHVVLSTLHTNSAIETIPRLLNMGLPAFMIAPSLTAVIAQRLVRKVCDNCAKERSLKKLEKKEMEDVLLGINRLNTGIAVGMPESIKQVGDCEKCSHTGYLGQIAVVEVLQVDNEIKNLILNGATSEEMYEEARRKRMITMKEDAIIKVIRGITSLEEANRVTSTRRDREGFKKQKTSGRVKEAISVEEKEVEAKELEENNS